MLKLSVMMEKEIALMGRNFSGLYTLQCLVRESSTRDHAK